MRFAFWYLKLKNNLQKILNFKTIILVSINKQGNGKIMIEKKYDGERYIAEIK